MNQAIDKITKIIQKYQNIPDEFKNTTHVETWLSQFSGQNIVEFSKEIAHILGNTFLSREFFAQKWIDIINRRPANYWQTINFLRIQKNGNSQNEMLDIFSIELQKIYNITTDQCGGGSIYIYIDDVIFSGNRALQDLRNWVCTAPDNTMLLVLSAVCHTGGKYHIETALSSFISERKKNINFQVFQFIQAENRKYYKDISNVLWPIALPNEQHFLNYLTQKPDIKNNFIPRIPQKAFFPPIIPFSSEAGRQVVEYELLVAGSKICQQTTKDVLKPLGFSNFGVGFGALHVTYRNCPNNAPLALWWGTLPTEEYTPHLQWYPLFPRAVYNRPLAYFM